MAQIPRKSVVSILKTLLVTEEEMARQAQSKPSLLRDQYHEGRVSGLRTALEVLDIEEDAPFLYVECETVETTSRRD